MHLDLLLHLQILLATMDFYHPRYCCPSCHHNHPHQSQTIVLHQQGMHLLLNRSAMKHLHLSNHRHQYLCTQFYPWLRFLQRLDKHLHLFRLSCHHSHHRLNPSIGRHHLGTNPENLPRNHRQHQDKHLCYLR